MSTEQENFDELIRQKFAEKQFGFNDENWEKMETKIKSTRRFNRNALWSSIFVIGLISGVAIMFLLKDYSSQNTITDNSTILSPNSQSISETNKNSTVNSTELTLPKNKVNADITNNSASKNNSKNSILKNESNSNSLIEKSSGTNIITESKNKNGSSNKKLKTEITHIENTNNSKKVALAYITNNQQATNLKETKSVNTTIGSKAKDDKLANLHSANDFKENQNQQTNSNNTTSSKVENGSDASPALKEEKHSHSDTKKNKEKQAEDKLNAAVNNSNTQANPNQSSTVTKTVDPTVTAANSSIKTKKKAAIEADSIVTAADLAPTEKTTTSNNFRNNDAAAANAVSGLAAATFITIDAGSHYTLGWNYANINEGRGFNAIAGIGINHYFNQKWALTSGIQYGSLAYLKATNKTFSTKEYSFGSTTIHTTINTKYLHYLVVPIMLEYNLNAKNALLGGGTVSYLINSNSSIITNSTFVGPAAIQADSSNASASKNSVKGYYNGAFSKFDATLCVGYRRRLSQRLSVVALANFGLIDVKKNTFFNINKTERNSGVKLIFTYNLFDF